MYIDREDKEILKITSMDCIRIITKYVKKNSENWSICVANYFGRYHSPLFWRKSKLSVVSKSVANFCFQSTPFGQVEKRMLGLLIVGKSSCVGAKCGNKTIFPSPQKLGLLNDKDGNSLRLWASEKSQREKEFMKHYVKISLVHWCNVILSK